MRLIPVLLALLCAIRTPAAPLPDDPALDRHVTLAVKGEALVDILPMIEEQTGARLRSARDVADQKATIFVDDKPLRQVMDELATLFQYRWDIAIGGGKPVYELWEDEKTRLEREQAYQDVLAKAWAELDAELDLKAQLSTMTEGQLKDFRSQLSKKLSQGSDPEAWRQWEALLALEKDPLSGPVARLYGKFPPKVLEAFRAELSIYYDSKSPEDEWKLPEDIAGHLVARMEGSITIDGQPPELDGVNVHISSNAYADYAAAGGSVTVRYLSPPRPPVALDGEVEVDEPAHSSNGGVYSLGIKRLPEMFPPRNTHLPQTDIGDTGSKEISLTLTEMAAESGIPAEPSQAYVNRSDVLVLIHKKLGLQVIADHYSQWSRWTAIDNKSLKTLLDSFKTAYDHSNAVPARADWGWDGGFVYLRATDVRTRNLQEVPNRILRPWQAAYAKNKSLGLDELAQISRLSRQQVHALRQNARFLRLGKEITTQPVLRLYGLLTPGQRKQAFADGTSIAAFTEEQRSALIDALPSHRSQVNPGSQPVVGIYRNGWRVDKPIPPPSAWASEPVSLQITSEQAKDRFYCEVSVGGGSSTSLIEAETFEEAWWKARADKPEIKKGNLVRVQNTQHKFVVGFADGTNYASTVEIPSRTPYSEIKAPE